MTTPVDTIERLQAELAAERARADGYHAELCRMAEQVPVAWASEFDIRTHLHSGNGDYRECVVTKSQMHGRGMPLYAAPVPAQQ